MTERVIVSLALLVILLVIALVSCDATARADGISNRCADVEKPSTVEGIVSLACIVGLLCCYIVGRVRNRRR